MAFIPETGTGVENANSLISVAAADAILAHVPYATAWREEQDDSVKESFLIEATAWASAPNLRYRGTRLSATQGLPFPRVEASDAPEYDPEWPILNGVVPSGIQHGIARLAAFLHRQGSEGSPFEAVGLADGTSVSIGPIGITPDSRTSVMPDDAARYFAPYLSRISAVGGIGYGNLNVIRC